jgi:hypothetical protein
LTDIGFRVRRGTARDGVAEGVLTLVDGTETPSDVVELATGCKKLQEAIRLVFGGGVAEKVGDSWGFNEQGVMTNMSARPGQNDLWDGGALWQRGACIRAS